MSPSCLAKLARVKLGIDVSTVIIYCLPCLAFSGKTTKINPNSVEATPYIGLSTVTRSELPVCNLIGLLTGRGCMLGRISCHVLVSLLWGCHLASLLSLQLSLGCSHSGALRTILFNGERSTSTLDSILVQSQTSSELVCIHSLYNVMLVILYEL